MTLTNLNVSEYLYSSQSIPLEHNNKEIGFFYPKITEESVNQAMNNSMKVLDQD